MLLELGSLNDMQCHQVKVALSGEVVKCNFGRRAPCRIYVGMKVFESTLPLQYPGNCLQNRKVKDLKKEAEHLAGSMSNCFQSKIKSKWIDIHKECFDAYCFR